MPCTQRQPLHDASATAFLEIAKADDVAKNAARILAEGAARAEALRIRRQTPLEMRALEWLQVFIMYRATIPGTIKMLVRGVLGLSRLLRRWAAMSLGFVVTHARLWVSMETRQERWSLCLHCERCSEPKTQRWFFIGPKVERRYCKGQKSCGEVECPEWKWSALAHKLKLKNYSCPLGHWTGKKFKTTIALPIAED